MMNEEVLMDDAFLLKAIVEQAPHDQTVLNVKPEEVNYSEIRTLQLEYRSILKINHLWEFTSLDRLDLNSNFIKKIEGLDRLINLTWLNLSFNSIEKIEGLECLQKLGVLNLSNNRISVIENMDKLEKLTHFFIANNLIGQLDNALYLRKFKNLFSINLFGNPASKEDDYKLFIAAYFPNLMLLDYRLLDKKTKNEASIKYQFILEEMNRKELEMQQADEAKRLQEAEVKLHTDAFVEFLNGSQLFESMVKDDPEIETLRCVPVIGDMLQTLEDQMAELCTQLFEIGLDEHKRRETEVNSFYSGRNEAVTDYQQKATHMLAHFEPQHKKRIAELPQLSDPDVLEVKIDHCTEEITQLSNSLMEVECQLVSRQEDIINKLDVNISDMVGNFSETVQKIFVQCRDLEDNYHEKVLVVAGNLDMDDPDELYMPSDVKRLFTDKDTVMDALATGHENHQLTIKDRETLLLTRVDAWKVALITGIQDKELNRNRMRISDINRYVDYLMEQLDELQ